MHPPRLLCSVSLLVLFAACSATTSRNPGAPRGQTNASPEQPSEAPVLPPRAPSGELAGLARAVCPEGPFPRPVDGELRADALLGTEPADLNPEDREYHLYEGPVWLAGALYFSDFRVTPGFPSRILRYSPGEKLSVALEESGTNGLALDPTGKRLLGARHKSKSVVDLGEGFKDMRPLAELYEGRPFNSPNDLTMRSDGHLYFTDPDFQAGEEKTQPSTSVYWVTPAGQVTAIDSGIQNPNGIALSPDENFLFVAGNLEQGFVKRYPLTPSGSVGEGVIILQGVTVPDGMTFDCAGNLYVTEHTNRRVRVITQDGDELGQITGLEKNVTNVAFGGPNRSTLYITMTAGLASVELPVPGLPY